MAKRRGGRKPSGSKNPTGSKSEPEAHVKVSSDQATEHLAPQSRSAVLPERSHHACSDESEHVPKVPASAAPVSTYASVAQAVIVLAAVFTLVMGIIVISDEIGAERRARGENELRRSTEENSRLASDIRAREEALRSRQNEYDWFSSHYSLDELERAFMNRRTEFPGDIGALSDWVMRADALLAGGSAGGGLDQLRSALHEWKSRARPHTEEMVRTYNDGWGQVILPLKQEQAWIRRMLDREPVPSEQHVRVRLSMHEVLSRLEFQGAIVSSWNLVVRARGGLDFSKMEEILVLAQRAAEVAKDLDFASQFELSIVLCYAYYFNAEFDLAESEMHGAWRLLDEWEERLGVESLAGSGWLGSEEAAIRENRTRLTVFRRELWQWSDGALRSERKSYLDRLERRILRSERRLDANRVYSFERHSDGYKFRQLALLVSRLDDLEDEDSGLLFGRSLEFGWGLARRLEFAKQILAVGYEVGVERDIWDRTIEEITRSSEYSGLRIGFDPTLVPLGRDPETGLQEFAFVPSGARPVRSGSGAQSLALSNSTAIVFVLVPGVERFKAFGASEGVRLDPYLISKYEMTQGQWVALSGVNPSSWPTPSVYDDGVVTLMNPVESVGWEECSELLACFGLQIPTELQWENACRAGSVSKWWFGDSADRAGEYCNVVDFSYYRNAGALDAGQSHLPVGQDDTFPFHAPVGSFVPNKYGLFSVAGNVAEWCRDKYSRLPQSVPREGDGLCDAVYSSSHVVRGGDFASPVDLARSDARRGVSFGARVNTIGVRPSKSVQVIR